VSGCERAAIKNKEWRMVRRAYVFSCLVVLATLASPALAQSTISGVVRDTSGAVFPGVKVEAASEALIEDRAPKAPTRMDVTPLLTSGPAFTR